MPATPQVLPSLRGEVPVPTDADRERLDAYIPRLRPGCECLMAPDAAGSQAFLLAALLVDGTSGDGELLGEDCSRDLEQLPAFVAEQYGRPVRELVRRFVSGERPGLPPPAVVAATTFSHRPMDEAQTGLRLRELAATGVDISLLRSQLAMTPEGRIESMVALARASRALQEAVAVADG